MWFILALLVAEIAILALVLHYATKRITDRDCW